MAGTAGDELELLETLAALLPRTVELNANYGAEVDKFRSIILQRAELTEQDLRNVTRIILSTWKYCNDKKARWYIKNLFMLLCSRAEKFTDVFVELLYQDWNGRNYSQGSRESSNAACKFFKWICIMEHGKSQLSPKFCDLLVLLLTRLYQPRFQFTIKKCLQYLCDSLGPETQKSLFKTLLKNDKTLIGLAYIVEYFTQQKTVNILDEETRKEIVELFVKEYILAKEEHSPQALDQISKNLLFNIISVDIFQSVLLPACQKAMLRSPETAIQVVGFTMARLNFDLSPYSLDLGKMLASALRLQDENVRNHAVFASRTLSVKIMEPLQLRVVIEWYFAVLQGVEGKIASAPHKISILKAIQAMSENDLEESSLHSIANWIFGASIKLIQTEVHEGTLLEYMVVLHKWCIKIGGEVTSDFLSYIPAGLSSLKGNVRTCFCGLLVHVFEHTRIHQLKTQIETLYKFLDKVAGQLGQASSFSDAISVAVILTNAKKWIKESIPEVVMRQLKSLLPSVNRKFIDSCTSSSISDVCALVDNMISDSCDEANELYFNVLAIAVMAKDYQARRYPKDVIHRLLSCSSGFESCIKLVRALEKNEGPEVSTHIREEILRFISNTCVKTLNTQDLESVSLNLIDLSHMCKRSYYWIQIVKVLGFKPEVIVNNYWNSTLSNYVINFDGSVHKRKALETFCLLHGEVVVKTIVEEFRKLNSAEGIKTVSREEYFIFLTPDGQLYDNSVLETGEWDQAKNLKRENKAYSYKEQLEELNLRKELEKQKLMSGKVPRLSSKQEEIMKLQLQKEAAIRQNLQQLNRRVQYGFDLLEAALKANQTALGYFIPDFIFLVVDFMKSPLVASYGVNFLLELGRHQFSSNWSSGYSISTMVIRIIKPDCELNQEWLREPMIPALKRVMGYLVTMAQEPDWLSASAYSYCFPLLRYVVYEYAKETNLIASVLNCTHLVLKARFRSDECNPESLPRTELCKLLYHIISTTEGSLQQQAVSTALEFAKSGIECVHLGKATRLAELHSHIESMKSSLIVSRDIGIRCLSYNYHGLKDFSTEIENRFRSHILRASHDPANEVSEVAKKLWKEGNYELDFELHVELLIGLVDSCLEVRESSAKALGALVEAFPSEVERLVNLIIGTYHDYLVMIPPVTDDFGRVLEEGIDNWAGRHGSGLALRNLAEFFTTDLATTTMTWLTSTTLSDRNPSVRNIMLEAAVEIVQVHGKNCLNAFASIIESHLYTSGDSGNYDSVRQACVVLMGCLAIHINPADSRVKSIFGTLIDTLSTPSEKVQEAVANCLPALVPAVASDSSNIMQGLLTKLMEAETYGERRGAAYGVAGMIKGLGILSLKQHDIMNLLAEGMQDKKNYRRREGSLMALELLCEFLGRLFEPYIVHVLPYLLQCLGDPNQYVREATENTARCVMSRLSGHGVKLVLPALLTALNEDSWRTKCGSVDLLGRMAYCAPKQLSGCLPMIVPQLIEVMGDSHVRVQDSAAKALGLIGSVIRNPEIQSVVPILLQALQDPGKKTSICLQALLKTEFVHFVDPPSLALIMPVVERAFQDRSTENRRMASQIIGNMYSLTDHSDLAPYMGNVMPGLKTSLLDPVPEVRAVAAKALGAMAKGMVEKCYDELLPWLMKTLVSETNSVDRSGAAQGLAEVIGALGEDKLQRFMPEIIRKADSDDLAPHVRDGYMMMFIYMPSVFEEAFVPYIGQIINPILKALADENEFVRETALRAGQRIVSGFAATAITLLLPELEKGIFDDNWRIRFSSVQLLGDLLYKISGVSGKMSTESAGDDDNFGTENSQQMIISSLGLKRRNQVLAGLYMGRSDVALMVRQAALHVWKVVVANTPKTLREILPTLFSLLLGCLASTSPDKRQVAARTLGDLVRKLGEKILPEIIPILEKGLESSRSDEREGVCVGLSEIMSATSREMVLAFVDILVPTLRRALCDSCPGVREAAAQTFSSLHATVGTRALDEILPFMMKKMDDPTEGEYALHGLGQVLMVKSKAVMPYLIPQLTASPVNTKTLATLSSVAGESLSRHLNKILPALITVLNASYGQPSFEKELKNCEQVILSVVDEHGVQLLLDELMLLSKTDQDNTRKSAITLISSYCVNTKADLVPHISILLKGLISLMTDDDESVLRLVAEAVSAVLKNVESPAQIALVEEIRQGIRFAKSDLKDKSLLPGLCIAKGIKPLLGVFREAILNASADVKEQAALGMGELIAFSNTEALKPSVIHITGPLIRILGDRYGPEVKIAVLDTLSLLLPKAGPNLRAFLPQLQTTFVKASNDPNSAVRSRAEHASTQLVFVQGEKKP